MGCAGLQYFEQDKDERDNRLGENARHLCTMDDTTPPTPNFHSRILYGGNKSDLGSSRGIQIPENAYQSFRIEKQEVSGWARQCSKHLRLLSPSRVLQRIWGIGCELPLMRLDFSMLDANAFGVVQYKEECDSRVGEQGC